MESCVNKNSCSWWICRQTGRCEIHFNSLPRLQKRAILGITDSIPPKPRIKFKLKEKITLLKKNKVIPYVSPITVQYQKQKERCFYCNEKTPFKLITRDHYKPKSKGGKTENNMVLACKFCNELKSDYDITGFRFYAKVLLEQTKNYSTADKLTSIIVTCDKILNNEIEIPFVKYGT